MANAGALTNDEIRQRIVRIFAQFVSDVDPDRLSDFLKQENVLGIGEYQEISARNPAPQNRCRSLLDHLLRKSPPRTFLVVREALRHDGHYLLNYIDEMHIMADHSPFNDDCRNLTRGSTTAEESFEADGRRLHCEVENQLQLLLMRNGELEGKLLQMERQTMADKAKILELVEKLETHEATWSIERDYLLKRQRELEHRHNSDIIIIRGLEHKLERQRKQFVVSYGDVGDREHGVCLLDESGHIVRSVVAAKSSVFVGLDAPSYIAVDYSKGSILVLDRNNKRVLLFSPTLVFKGELLSRDDGLHDSHRMFIDSFGGRLFVADNIMGWRDGRVLAFDIRL